MTDREADRLSARGARHARVGVSGAAAWFAGTRLPGLGLDRGRNATASAAALRRRNIQS
jgi:hypothetical protein